MQTCNSIPVEVLPVKVFRTDSVYIHTTDTITNTIHVPFYSVPYINHDRMDLSDTNVFHVELKDTLLNTYVYSEQDSLLDYEIRVDATIRPSDVRIKYDLKNFTIHDTISTYVKDSVYELDTRSFLSIGANIGGSKNSFSFTPTLMYNHKRNNTYIIGYDLINKSYIIGFSKKISMKK